ncbi:unnamed protein product [Moneuplotes crassus]|uniref:Uncharacterized protein n=1 Tax=Euplotes crassus TaxID=5936 RepID=A0AAD1XH22_EUPCR|nr:unnamed protein product [Moneuplotes crassus]
MELGKSSPSYAGNDNEMDKNEPLEARLKGRARFSPIPVDELSVLVISKPFDQECNECFIEVLSLLKKYEVKIYTTKSSLEAIKDDPIVKTKVKPLVFSQDVEINRIITLGGDGTILFAIKLFYNKKVPPMISFGMGSVGYLCAFDSQDVTGTLVELLNLQAMGKNDHISDIDLIRPIKTTDPPPIVDHKDRLKVTMTSNSKKETFMVTSTIFEEGEKEFDSGASIGALNEFVLESESFYLPFTCGLYVNETFLTDISACGLIISTSTGSTAYGMSAGGSIVQAGVEAICISAVNPSSISFRPLILPFNCKIALKIPKGKNENSVRGVVDGDFKFMCTDEDEITIEGSSDPIPFVSKEEDDPMTSWIKRVSSTVLNY